MLKIALPSQPSLISTDSWLEVPVSRQKRSYQSFGRKPKTAIFDDKSQFWVFHSDTHNNFPFSSFFERAKGVYFLVFLLPFEVSCRCRCCFFLFFFLFFFFFFLFSWFWFLDKPLFAGRHTFAFFFPLFVVLCWFEAQMLFFFFSCIVQK